VSLVGGMALALVTPARVGEVARGSYLRDSEKWKIGGLVMIDKGFDVLALCVLSIAGAWKLIGVWAGAGLVVVAVIGLAVVYRPRPVAGRLQGMPSGLPLQTKLKQIWASMDALSPRWTTVYLALTFASFAVVLLQFGIILLSWHSWSPDIVFFTFPLVVLTNVLPITIGGLGIREGTAALLLSHYGVSPSHAAVAAFLMFAVNTALPGLVGALMLPPAGKTGVRATPKPADRT